MFIGHIAVGFAAKKAAPRTSLALLVTAPVFADVLWPIFILAGIEHVRIVPGFTAMNAFDLYDMPWSHSLLMDVVWAALFGGIYYAVTRYRAGAVWLALGVLSHWLLDWIAHLPDMQLYPGGAGYGLGLWTSRYGTIALESVMYAGGEWLYLSSTKARDRIGKFGFWSLAIVLYGIYIGGTYGPPPPSANAAAGSVLALTVVVYFWGWWVDAHREPLPR